MNGKRLERLESATAREGNAFFVVDVNEGETVLCHVGARVLTVEEFEREFPETTLIIVERVKRWKLDTPG